MTSSIITSHWCVTVVYNATAPQFNRYMQVIKTTYVKKTGIWKVYWQRADLKWHSYSPIPEVDTLDDFLTLVDKDEHHCFRG